MLLATLYTGAAFGTVVDFDAEGAISGADGSTAVAFKNTALINKLARNYPPAQCTTTFKHTRQRTNGPLRFVLGFALRDAVLVVVQLL